MAATQILRLTPNVPEVIALKFSDGKEVDGRYGPQVFFSLEDGRSLYADPNLAEAIDELRLRKGQPFEVTKTRKGYDVRKIEGAPPPAPVPVPLPAPPPPPETPTLNAPTRLLMGSLVAAVDAALEAESYAKRKGMEIAFEAEDIRALAATVFIQFCKQGGF